MPYGFGGPFSEPFYEGGGASSLAASGVAEVALAGRAYMINWEAGESALSTETVPMLRQQADNADTPGKASVNPEGLWRATRESWHMGQGQEHLDAEDSNPFRYDDGQGVDPWDKRKLGLLHATAEKTSSANTNLRLAVAGTHLYWTNGTALGYFDADIATDTITNVTGVPGVAASSIATDGFNVITAHGASGVYKTTRGAATTAAHITGTVSLLGFARGRFLAAQGRSVYDITALTVGASGALPVALFTQGNTDFTWVDFAEGFGFIFMGGYSGDKSLIYRTAVKQDGTALDAPTVAAELPDGEVITALYGYLGRFICVGTNKGLRLAIVNGSGELSMGARIDTPSSVLCFEGQSQFIWYGLTAYTLTSTGLGRLSTEFFVDPGTLQPAYASDLMVTGSGAVQSVVTFNNRRVFTVSGDGLYYESDNCVASGYFTTGKISYGISENKVGLWFDLQHQEEAGAFEVSVSLDGEAFVSIGTAEASELPSSTFGLGEADAGTFDMKVTMTRDISDATLCPFLLSWLLRVQPKAKMTKYIVATILMAPEVEDLVGNTLYYDTAVEQAVIESLHNEKTITTWQEGTSSYSVSLEDYKVIKRSLVLGAEGYIGFNADIPLKLKRIE